MAEPLDTESCALDDLVRLKADYTAERDDGR